MRKILLINAAKFFESEFTLPVESRSRPGGLLFPLPAQNSN
jgi:hypothetical protein